MAMNTWRQYGGIYANEKFQKEFLVENLIIQNNLMIGAEECGVKNLIFGNI